MSPKVKRTLLILFSLVQIIGIAAGIYAYSIYHKQFIKKNILTGGDPVYLYLDRYDSTASVLQKLEAMNVVQDMESLEWAMEKKNYRGGNVVSGKYEIRDGMTNNVLVNSLRAGNGRIPVNLTFSLARDLEQLSGKLAKNISADSLDIINWLQDPDSIASYGFNEATIISMFIPNTYFVNWDMTAPELMKRMAQEYKDFWTDERKAKAKEIGLSQSEVSTLASIVYWETKMPGDMEKVAGVYINRLEIGMPLQADPTLIYALGDYSIKRVLNIHKEVESPYNTYKYAGLPPGPVLVSPPAYIDAVLDHADHNYYYFVAKPDFSGYSNFSETYSQHLDYARLYQTALDKKERESGNQSNGAK